VRGQFVNPCRQSGYYMGHVFYTQQVCMLLEECIQAQSMILTLNTDQVQTYCSRLGFPIEKQWFTYNIGTAYIYRVSQEERTKLRESVSYVKLYRYNPKHLYPKLNGYGDNG